MEELLLLIQNVGFPILSVIIIAWYVMKMQTDYREDNKERNDWLVLHIDTITQTNNVEIKDLKNEIKDLNKKLDTLMS